MAKVKAWLKSGLLLTEDEGTENKPENSEKMSGHREE